MVPPGEGGVPDGRDQDDPDPDGDDQDDPDPDGDDQHSTVSTAAVGTAAVGTAAVGNGVPVLHLHDLRVDRGASQAVLDRLRQLRASRP